MKNCNQTLHIKQTIALVKLVIKRLCLSFRCVMIFTIYGISDHSRWPRS